MVDKFAQLLPEDVSGDGGPVDGLPRGRQQHRVVHEGAEQRVQELLRRGLQGLVILLLLGTQGL